MNVSPQIVRAFERAQQLHAEGRLPEAEQAYCEIATPGEHREAVLFALSELYRQSRRLDRAVETLIALTEEAPDELSYYVQLVKLLEQGGQPDAAIDQYRRFLARHPDSPDAHFNLALVLKNAMRYGEAESEYKESIRLGISGAEEAYSNLGVLYSAMRKPDKAQETYEKAIAIDAHYVPALFNLAGLHEERGDKDRAIELYRQILSFQPQHWESLARIAYATRVTGENDGIVGELLRAIDSARDDRQGREWLYFALGKVYDELGRYDEAFDAYRSGNELAKSHTPRWDRAAAEQGFSRLISLFDDSWLDRAATGFDASPIFVCGMFRSGSTLIEQILAAHQSIGTAGEFDYLPWLIKRWFSPYPDTVRDISTDELSMVAGEYVSKLQELFPGTAHVTDKRPDNFLHLGLIGAMFPASRIVYTKRNRLDNCLSVYFAHLHGLGYATDLGDIAHYYEQHERLMAHWQAILGDKLFVVDYDRLVGDPEPVLRALLDFLGLPWDDSCLQFQDAAALVKTASVWQVRESLYTRSSGRWKNYEPYLADLKDPHRGRDA